MIHNTNMCSCSVCEMDATERCCKQSMLRYIYYTTTTKRTTPASSAIGMEVLKLFSMMQVLTGTHNQREKKRLHIFNDVCVCGGGGGGGGREGYVCWGGGGSCLFSTGSSRSQCIHVCCSMLFLRSFFTCV